MKNEQIKSAKEFNKEQDTYEYLLVRQDQIEDALALFKERGFDVELVSEDELKEVGLND